MKRDATETEADIALAVLKPIMDAAYASNQTGENAVVAVVHAYDCHSGLVKALEELLVMDWCQRNLHVPGVKNATIALAKAKGEA